MKIYLIRHARQSSPACNVDVDLSEEGIEQARLLGRRLEKYHFDALYSSDLVRAVQTAKIAFDTNDELCKNMKVRKELNEINFGNLTGKDDKLVKKFYNKYYETQLNKFRNKEDDSLLSDFFVPEDDMLYPEGEDTYMLMQRVLPVVKEWINSGYENIAVVTHGGVIRSLVSSLLSGSYNRRLMFASSLENCSISCLMFDKNKSGFYLERFNDYAHLEDSAELLREKFLKPNDK